ELSGTDIGHSRSGLIELALTDADAEALRARQSWQAERGLRAELLGAVELRELEPRLSPSLAFGLRLADEGHVHARALARALAQAAAVEGARFLQGRYVRRVTVAAGRATGVELDGET